MKVEAGAQGGGSVVIGEVALCVGAELLELIGDHPMAGFLRFIKEPDFLKAGFGIADREIGVVPDRKRGEIGEFCKTEIGLGPRSCTRFRPFQDAALVFDVPKIIRLALECLQ